VSYYKQRPCAGAKRPVRPEHADRPHGRDPWWVEYISDQGEIVGRAVFRAATCARSCSSPLRTAGRALSTVEPQRFTASALGETASCHRRYRSAGARCNGEVPVHRRLSLGADGPVCDRAVPPVFGAP